MNIPVSGWMKDMMSGVNPFEPSPFPTQPDVANGVLDHTNFESLLQQGVEFYHEAHSTIIT